MCYIIIAISAIVLFGVLPLIGIALERKDFNNGICQNCGKKLIYFDNDSQGGRGYACSCHYVTWVSYNCVDKNYKGEKE